MHRRLNSRFHRPVTQNKNTRTLKRLAIVGVAMLALTFISVPLYSLFCKTTGFGGTTQVAVKAPDHIVNRKITVRFNTDVAPGLPWEFKAPMISMDVKPGEVHTVTFSAKNLSKQHYEGVALYNVQPDRAGLYFSKIQCFCFDKSPLDGGQAAEYPVQFFVDPAMADDPQMKNVSTITLSYTFFAAKSAGLTKAKGDFEAWQKRLIKALEGDK